MDENLIIETWDVFKEYIPEKTRETAAHQYLDFLVGQDVETSVLEGLMGYDSHLDSAITLVLDNLSDGDSDDEDEDWDAAEDDEDY